EPELARARRLPGPRPGDLLPGRRRRGGSRQGRVRRVPGQGRLPRVRAQWSGARRCVGRRHGARAAAARAPAPPHGL
ncbi:MAG: WhiB-type transcriptional regulator, partial [uncultured Acidimicrobiales bacterium]